MRRFLFGGGNRFPARIGKDRVSVFKIKLHIRHLVGAGGNEAVNDCARFFKIADFYFISLCHFVAGDFGNAGGIRIGDRLGHNLDVRVWRCGTNNGIRNWYGRILRIEIVIRRLDVFFLHALFFQKIIYLLGSGGIGILRAF